MTDSILETVNFMQPNTIHKLALRQQDLPHGQPYMNCFVELFDGAQLPSESDVIAKKSDYQAYINTQAANAVIKRQIAALESTQTLRRIRESIKDSTWMDALDAQIAALRSQLI